jgi:secondary thiamine-phosphate synthase enzyme
MTSLKGNSPVDLVTASRPQLRKGSSVSLPNWSQRGNRIYKWLEELAPFNPSPEVYHHNRTGEINADPHLKRTIMGREVVVAITAGELDFGPWEQIFYGEFDGRREKRVLIKIIGE